jgi:3-oxoacyl-[acyl-carrier-protein] synthase-3
MNSGIGILNTASYIGGLLQTNEEVCSHISGLTPQWIVEKTGIRQRYIAQTYETAAVMAGLVAQELTYHSSVDIDLIIITTFSQDYYFPPLAAKIHHYIKAGRDCQIMDINTNCTGLITGTTIAAERMMIDSKIKHALVIGVEVLSKFVNERDKFTAPFFSDGAAGVLLGRVPAGYGLINSKFCTDSSVYESVRCTHGFAQIEHDGRATWTQAITHLPYVLKALVHSEKLAMKDIDFFIFHQANKVLIDYIMDKHRIPHEKTYTNVERIGNTGAASIGIALDEAMKQGLIRPGNLIVLAGIGAGFNFGANLWKMY